MKIEIMYMKEIMFEEMVHLIIDYEQYTKKVMGLTCHLHTHQAMCRALEK